MPKYRVKTFTNIDREWIVDATSEDDARDNFFQGELIDVDEWPEEVRMVEEAET